MLPISFLATFCLLATTLLVSASEQLDYDWFEEGRHPEMMGWSDAQKQLFREADPELLAIFPVANPDDDPVVHGNDFFRNALAVKIGDVLVVNHFALQYHWDWDPVTKKGLDRHNAGHSPAYVKRSLDDGRSWEPGVRLDETVGLGDLDAFFMTAMGTRGDAIFILSRIDGDGGFYRSDDAGVTWSQVENNLFKSELGSLGGIGPVMIDHPKAGLMIFGTPKEPDPENPGKRRIVSGLIVANSTDEGRTWETVRLDFDDKRIQPVEPTAVLLPDGEVLVYSRNGANHRDGEPSQIVLDVQGPADYKVRHAGFANHRFTQNPDTQGVIYNPATDRVEALFSNRGGSKPFANDAGISVSLWSLPLERVLTGDTTWRYHGLLNTMQGDYGDGDPERPRDWRRFQDGSHPGLGVIDLERQKHLAFLHMAASTSSFCGTYLIERALDTDAVGDYLIANAAVPFGADQGEHELRHLFAEKNDRYHFFSGADGEYQLSLELDEGEETPGVELFIDGKSQGRADDLTWSGVPIRRGEEIRLRFDNPNRKGRLTIAGA